MLIYVRGVYLRFDRGLDLRLPLILVDPQHPAHPVYVLLFHPKEITFFVGSSLTQSVHIHARRDVLLHDVEKLIINR